MADKKISEQLGVAIFEAGKEIVGKKLSKAQYDKSYKTTIVGCNRYFTDDVPKETQAELIKKYNIPEVSVSGVYYTFRINGNWYVKSSNNDFKLYEEVVVRVPNGNWDNMFIEVQRDTVVEGGGTGVLSAVKIDGNKLFYNGEEYRLQFGNNKRIMCVTKGKLHYIVETEDINSSYIEAATAVINGLTNDCDIEFDANIFYPNNTFNIQYLFESSTKLTGITIDWGDGITTTYPEISHVYGKQGMFRVKISGLPDSITSINCAGINHFWNGQNGCKVGSHTYIGGSITTINTYSTYISKLTWGENVTEIRQSYGMGEAICDELREMAIPPKVSVIGSGGYDGQSNYAYIPPECISIEGSAFSNTSLKTIEISPEGETLSIEQYAFSSSAGTNSNNGYSCVTSLEIPARVQLGSNSFYQTGTRIVKFESGTEEIPSYAINSINRKGSLGVSCFSNYNELYIFIPSTVTSIGDGIIYGGSDSKRVIIVYEGSSSDWDRITKSSNWNSGNTKIEFIYGAEEYNSYSFYVREIKKLHEFKSDDDAVYTAGKNILINNYQISSVCTGRSIGNNNELYNDYSRTNVTRLESLANIKKAYYNFRYNHIEGYNHSIRLHPRQSYFNQYTNYFDNIEYNHIEGNSNMIQGGISNCYVGGYHNKIGIKNYGELEAYDGVSSCIIAGSNNEVGGILPFGKIYSDLPHTVSHDSIVVGRGNKVVNVGDCAVFGIGHQNYEYIKKYASDIVYDEDNPIRPVAIFGQYGYFSSYTHNPSTDKNLLIVGGGTAGEFGGLRNVFVVDYEGNVNCSGQVSALGQDYAEYYEWLDENSENEDRRGLFVTLSGRKIKIANEEDDYILGVVSATPTVVGNSAELEWAGRYKRDVFGNLILDEKGEKILSDDYDEKKEYVPRRLRKEYSPIGTHGQLIVIDNGECTVDSYCKCGANGKAVPSDTQGFRVVERLDDTHIRIIIK